MKEVKQIQIIHPELGQILIHSKVEEEINNKIGTITDDYAKYPMYYHADIFKNQDGTFEIRNLNIIKPTSIIVGVMRTSCGSKNSVKVITNKNVSDDIIVYPSGVVSVSYN